MCASKSTNQFSDEKFAVLGLGISGLATIEYLITKGAREILVYERKDYNKLDSITKDKLTSWSDKVICVFGKDDCDECLEYDTFVVSPGMPLNHPILEKAKKLGKTILPEVELAANEAKQFIGITGTNGKSTTTAWTSHILESPACGNIGVPFVEAVIKSPEANWFVCELSSYQLAHSKELAPQIAAITNITPDHLNWHGSWEHYLESKQKITALQNSNDWLLLPDSEPLKLTKTKAQILWIRENPIENCEGNSVYENLNGEVVALINGVKSIVCQSSEIPLPGKHNLQNALFAIGISLLAGLKPEQIKERLLSFKGLAHRIEFISEKYGKKFYNDSKATNPESTIVALKAFNEKITWLAGGRDKLTPLEDLCEVAKLKVGSIILYGEAAARFQEALIYNQFKGKIQLVKDLDEALKLACDENSKIVLLSPACASFDQFKNFEERGDYFKRLVAELR